MRSVRFSGERHVDRRTFLTLSGIGAAGLLLPNTRLIAAEQLLSPVDAARNRRLADTALTTAKSAGASYCDVRVGRYLRQFAVSYTHLTLPTILRV